MGPKGHVQVRRSLANVPWLGFAALSVIIIVIQIKIVAVVYNLYSNLIFFLVVYLIIIFYSHSIKKKKKHDFFQFLRGYIHLLCLVQVHRTGT